MESYFNYTIVEFYVETSAGFIDLTQSVAALTYSEDITSPVTYVTAMIVNTGGILSKLKLRGGEKVRVILEQKATGGKFTLDENNNTYYIYNIANSTTESTKETFILEMVPREVLTNETTRCFRRYDTDLKQTVEKILKDELKTTRYKSSNIEKTVNKYSFMANARKPFTVLGWVCPKGIPQIERGKSGEGVGTAGFLFFENQEGYNFKSVDSLFDRNRRAKETYFYKEIVTSPADPQVNFKITAPPVFNKNVNILDNLRVGMYGSVNYFFDTNTRKFYGESKPYLLSKNYNLMNLSGNETLDLPSIIIDKPSRLMVKMLDNGQMNKAGKLETPDKRIEYQGQGVSRYNLLFSQSLNITVPLNLRLTVGDVINVEFGQITKEDEKKGLRDNRKSGKYVISKLKHGFSDNKGLTGLELVRDSYGATK
jgi:hypothetical protein